jgi:hypothetical protein
MTGQRIEELQTVDLVVEERDPDRLFGVLGGKDIDHVAAYAKGAAPEVGLVALVLHVGQPLDDRALTHAVADAHGEDHLLIFLAITETIDARNGGNDHAITPFEQALGGGETHLFDVFIDRRVLFDEQVARRNVGLGLVVIVIGDEILDRMVGKELAELGIELRRQRLVRCQDQRWPATTRDDVGHGVGLSRPGDAEQGLESESIAQPLDQLVDRSWLITGRQERLMEAERAPLEGDERKLFGRACAM